MSPWVVLGLSVAFAAVPTLLYAFLIWWIDWYERESPRLVLLSFFWGAVVAAGVGAFLEVALNVPLQVIVSPHAADFLLVTFGAPPIEEAIKGLLLLIILHDTEFDNLTDGIVYGAIIGLGFSLSENVAYFFSAYEEGGALVWLSNILFRSAFCCALHATATALTGAAIGFAKFRGQRSRIGLIACGFAAATTVHIGWNGLLSLGDLLQTGALALLSIVALPLVGAGVGALFLWSLQREQVMIRRELAAEVAAGWLPAAHVDGVADLTARRRAGWLSAHIDRDHYVRVLTELAFRRYQLRHIPSRFSTSGARISASGAPGVGVSDSDPGAASSASGRLRAHYTHLVTQLRSTAQGLLGLPLTEAPPTMTDPTPDATAAPVPARPTPPPDPLPPR